MIYGLRFLITFDTTKDSFIIIETDIVKLRYWLELILIYLAITKLLTRRVIVITFNSDTNFIYRKCILIKMFLLQLSTSSSIS
jgi:hypothetical protein